jgi:hypothetical protein
MKQSQRSGAADRSSSVVLHAGNINKVGCKRVFPRDLSPTATTSSFAFSTENKQAKRRFQVLTAASMMFRVVFWDVLPCKIIECDFLMMKAASTSETSVDNHFTRQYNPEDNSEHQAKRSPPNSDFEIVNSVRLTNIRILYNQIIHWDSVLWASFGI